MSGIMSPTSGPKDCRSIQCLQMDIVCPESAEVDPVKTAINDDDITT